MANEWHVSRPNFVCSATGREFAVGEQFQAYLYETADGYVRRDFADDLCPLDARAAVGIWRLRRPAPSAPKTPILDAAALLAFFERLGQREDLGDEQLRFRFVLALLLWRKRVITFDASYAEDDAETWVFRRPRTPDTYNVIRPALDEAQVEALSHRLEQVIAGELAALTDSDSDGGSGADANAAEPRAGHPSAPVAAEVSDG